MNRNLLIIFDDLELRMIHANPFPPQTWFAEYDQALPGCDHFLHVVQIEPPAHEWFAQSICLRFLQCCFENFLPPAKTPQRSLNHVTAKTNRHVAFLVRKMRELRSIFVTPGEMRKQIFHGLYAETPQCEEFRARDPI